MASTYVIVGGGTTAPFAAQAIRERDPEGRIVIAGAGKHPPYDRPPLSKQMLAGDDFAPEDALSKDDSFYPERRIELLLGRTVQSIDRDARTLRFADGETLAYDKLLVATGSSAARLDVPGADLPAVRYVRSLDDAVGLREALQQARRAVVVGAGFLGMEAASGCIARGIETTVVERAPHPWPLFESATVGGAIQRALEEAGGAFMGGQSVVGFEQANAETHVLLEGGARVPADVALVAVGARQNLDLPRAAGLKVDDRHGVMVDSYLRTADPHVWAAGDIACFTDPATGRRLHVEHHLNAKWQGAAAGANMAGEQAPYERVAYFFSDLLGLHMAMRGDAGATRDATVLGAPGAAEFVELCAAEDGWLRRGTVVSRDEDRVDKAADALEGLIKDGTPLRTVRAADLGL